jgi:RHS repeat-associated protein
MALFGRGKLILGEFMKHAFSRWMAAPWLALSVALATLVAPTAASAVEYPTQYDAYQACIAYKAYLDEHVDDTYPEWTNTWYQVCDWYPTGYQTKHGYFLKWRNNGDIYPEYRWFNYAYTYADCVPPNNPQPDGSCEAPPPPPVHPSLAEALNLGSCDGLMCGNPINVGTGNKFQAEIDLQEVGLLGFTRYYNSDPLAYTHAFGQHWTNTYSRAVESSATDPNSALVLRPDGRVYKFVFAGGVWASAANPRATLARLTDSGGATTGWVFHAVDGRESENFDSWGRLTSIVRSDGASVTLTYNNGATESNGNDFLLTRVQAQDGRRFYLAYDTSGRLSQLTDAAGQVITYGYDSLNRLTSVTYPGAVSKTYLYNEAANMGGGDIAAALTGIVDELGVRFATFKYQPDGRAVSTEHVGNVDKFSVSFGQGGSTVTLPSGLTQSRTFTSPNGVVRPGTTSTSLGGQARNYAYTYDAAGNPDVVTDPLLTTTDYDFDAASRPTQVIESANKASTKRTTQTDWHATFDVPIERRVLNAAGVLEAKSTWTYNPRGQVAAATRVNLANASLSRTTTYTYCEAAGVSGGTCPVVGLLLSVDGPRSDVTDVTTFTYYQADDAACESAPTTCPYRKGDLWKVTNAKGHVVETLAYDGAGRPTSMKDANGVVTDLEYSPRGWLTARKIRGTAPNTEVDDAITRFEYNDLGLMTKVTQVVQPQDSFVSFGYDPAHRLTSVTDSLGNSITYLLDASGNRIQEDTKNSAQVVKRTLSRIFDGLSQLQTSADAQASPTDYTYDASGNLDTVRDPLLRITDNTVDPLGRVTQVIANTGGGTSDKAITQFQYDALDNLRAVVDPKGLSTLYNYDSLGNLSDLSSPDTGSTIYSYDLAGNRIAEMKADNVTQGYTYDELGRLTAKTFAHAAQNMTYTYDVTQSDCGAGEGYSIGRLTKIQDANGSTRFCYDARGNRVRMAQSVNVGFLQTATVVTGTSYDAADRVQAISYTSGSNTAVITYFRNPNGQVERIDVKPTSTAAQVPLVSAVTYLPFGPINTITFGNGRVLTKAYDQNYAIDAVSDSAASNPLSLDLSVNSVGNVTGLTERTGATTTLARTFQYDGLDRLTAQKSGATTVEGFTYDATGNRLSKSAGSTTEAYSYPASSHQLASVDGVARTYYTTGELKKVGRKEALHYDDDHRLTDVGSKKAWYNALGQRVAKAGSVGGADVQFVYDEAGHLVGEYSSNGSVDKQYVWLDDTLVGIISAFDGSAYQFVETDHLGTPRAVVHPSKNQIIWRWDLNPTVFGEHAASKNPDGDSLNYTLNLRYPGQYYDQESGFSYNYFRDYEPGTGRYLESDPIGLRGGPSTYGYANQSPLANQDPTGQSALALAAAPSSIAALGPPALVAGAWVGGFYFGTWLNDEFGAGLSDAIWNASHSVPERPKRMTRLQERAYDRHCVGSDDPCAAIKAALQVMITEALGKQEEALVDKSTLYLYAYSIPNAAVTGTSTTWLGHIGPMYGRIANIQATIQVAEMMGCDVSREKAQARALFVPIKPRYMQ